MIYRFVKMIFFFLFFTNLCLAASGGSTVVGDGGYAAICKGNTYFYDRLEYLLENDKSANEEPQKLTQSFTPEVLSIARSISKDFSLNTIEGKELIRAAKNMATLQRFTRNPYDGVTYSSIAWVVSSLQTKHLTPEQKVMQFLKDNSCELAPIATLITQKTADKFDIADACTEATSRHCLIVDRLLFKDLHLRDRVCLITHELLRLIPNAFQSEKQLRSLTFSYCSLK